MAQVSVTASLTFTVTLDDSITQPRRTSTAIEDAAKAIRLNDQPGVTLIAVAFQTSAPGNGS